MLLFFESLTQLLAVFDVVAMVLQHLNGTVRDIPRQIPPLSVVLGIDQAESRTKVPNDTQDLQDQERIVDAVSGKDVS
ncbi:hypothetical protein V502_07629 [Pseudogymnoascus sp. VKM F-4520 (FW-2644)]|nr:hypothetical protein V502_07629 [Pseudogymnoascus sp. VKM F-4520 (FW-2644)]